MYASDTKGRIQIGNRLEEQAAEGVGKRRCDSENELIKWVDIDVKTEANCCLIAQKRNRAEATGSAAHYSLEIRHKFGNSRKHNQINTEGERNRKRNRKTGTSQSKARHGVQTRKAQVRHF